MFADVNVEEEDDAEDGGLNITAPGCSRQPQAEEDSPRM